MKKREKELKFCVGDFLVILLVLTAIAGSVFFWIRSGKNTADTVVVYQNGERVRELSLERDTELTVEGAYTNKVVIRDGEVFIEESNCPGNDCVHMGKIHESGRSIVCLPNRMEIRIEGASEVDFVVQ